VISGSRRKPGRTVRPSKLTPRQSSMRSPTEQAQLRAAGVERLQGACRSSE
jgi:hypothetical protein